MSDTIARQDGGHYTRTPIPAVGVWYRAPYRASDPVPTEMPPEFDVDRDELVLPPSHDVWGDICILRWDGNRTVIPHEFFTEDVRFKAGEVYDTRVGPVVLLSWSQNRFGVVRAGSLAAWWQPFARLSIAVKARWRRYQGRGGEGMTEPTVLGVDEAKGKDETILEVHAVVDGQEYALRHRVPRDSTAEEMQDWLHALASKLLITLFVKGR